MTQDFAKIRVEPLLDRQPAATPSPRFKLFTGFVVGTVVGCCIGAAGSIAIDRAGLMPWFGKAAEPTSDRRGADSAVGSAGVEGAGTACAPLPTAIDLTGQEPDGGAAAASGFDFYDELTRTPEDTEPPARMPDDSGLDADRAGDGLGDGLGDGVTDRPGSGLGDATTGGPYDGPGEAMAGGPGNRPDDDITHGPGGERGDAAHGVMYLLQAGAFRRLLGAQEEAERQRALGLNAKVERQEVAGRVLHLVLSGPYSDQDALQRAEEVLRSNDITSLRLRLE